LALIPFPKKRRSIGYLLRTKMAEDQPHTAHQERVDIYVRSANTVSVISRRHFSADIDAI
jgi:hypothetical protein